MDESEPMDPGNTEASVEVIQNGAETQGLAELFDARISRMRLLREEFFLNQLPKVRVDSDGEVDEGDLYNQWLDFTGRISEHHKRLESELTHARTYIDELAQLDGRLKEPFERLVLIEQLWQGLTLLSVRENVLNKHIPYCSDPDSIQRLESLKQAKGWDELETKELYCTFMQRPEAITESRHVSQAVLAATLLFQLPPDFVQRIKCYELERAEANERLELRMSIEDKFGSIVPSGIDSSEELSRQIYSAVLATTDGSQTFDHARPWTRMQKPPVPPPVSPPVTVTHAPIHDSSRNLWISGLALLIGGFFAGKVVGCFIPEGLIIFGLVQLVRYGVSRIRKI